MVNSIALLARDLQNKYFKKNQKKTSYYFFFCSPKITSTLIKRLRVIRKNNIAKSRYKKIPY